MAFDFKLPKISDITDLTDKRQARKLRSYLVQLTEQLRYVLGNLDSSNMTGEAAEKLDRAADSREVDSRVNAALLKAEADHRDALSGIVDAASAVTAAYSSAIDMSDRSIRQDVSANYALKSELESGVYGISTVIDQQAASITATLTRVLTLENAVGDFSNTELTNYVRFDENGVELGENSSDFKARLTSTRLSFIQGAREVAYISNNRLYITDAIVTGALSVGSAAGAYDWHVEGDRSLSLVYREE